MATFAVPPRTILDAPQKHPAGGKDVPSRNLRRSRPLRPVGAVQRDDVSQGACRLTPFRGTASSTFVPKLIADRRWASSTPHTTAHAISLREWRKRRDAKIESAADGSAVEGQALSNGLFRVTVHSLAHAAGRPIIATGASWDEAKDKLFDRLMEKAE